MTNSALRHPYTFLEIAIAITITLMIALALYSYSSSVSKSWEQMVREKNRFNELLNLDRAIDKVLANTVPFTWRDDEKQKYPFIVADPHGLRVAYLHQLRDAEEGALRFAEFILQDNELYLLYSDRPFFDWAEAGARQQQVLLAEEVEEVSFRYADWTDDADVNWQDRLLWLDEWETVNSERMDAPLAVMMTVRWRDGRSQTWIRRTMGNAYRERFGKWTPLPEDKR